MKYRIEYSVPDLTDDEIHIITIDGDIEDMWSHVNLKCEVWDINVWQDESPIQAAVYPTSVRDDGCYTTDTMNHKAVALHSVRRVNAIGRLTEELLSKEGI